MKRKGASRSSKPRVAGTWSPARNGPRWRDTSAAPAARWAVTSWAIQPVQALRAPGGTSWRLSRKAVTSLGRDEGENAD